MSRILVAYVTHSGSTREVAEFMGAQLNAQGHRADVMPISEQLDLAAYDMVIAGGLLYRFGWHSEVVAFLNSRQAELINKPVALFVMGMGLVRTPACDDPPCPLFIDPQMLRQPAKGEPRGMERQSTLESYLQKAVPAIEVIQPLSLAFFAGKVDFGTLPFVENLAMRVLMLLMGQKAGDRRAWDTIRTWVTGLDPYARAVKPVAAG